MKPLPPLEPIAIVGLALRFPGNIGDADQLWTALLAGQDLVTEVAADRWPTSDLQHPRRAEPGRSITFAAGVLGDVDGFDAAFFGISPREAELMDPQQRLLLELSWEAFENAGIKPSVLAGTDCAVFVGISGLDYGMRMLDDLAGMAAHSMTGNTLSVAANRLSYVLDLHGPSVAVDTACSSSLVALHQACGALRAREASAALVGGVNLLLHPYPFIGFTKASMLSADGRCRAFGDGGDGYVRAEGGAMLLLKPLAAARRDGDRVLGVIRASGVNNDGARKSGLTIPSAEGQAELMRRVLAQAALRGTDIDYLEAHGTGTRIGDPIEASSIGAVYGAKRAAPLPIGSIKTNLGHMEPVSGMAGLAKALLVLGKGVIPPSLHSEHLNPTIDFSGLGLAVAREPVALKARGRPLRAAVNSFGFGGVNAHVILEAAAPPPRVTGDTTAPAAVPLVLSAQDTPALRELARRHLRLLADATDRVSVAHATFARRELLAERLALADVGTEKSLEQLEAFAAGADPADVLRERALPGTPRVAFVYSGNGAQWTGMGRRLMQEHPRFADSVAQAAAFIGNHGGPDVVAAIASDDPEVRQDTAFAQPVLFALQVAMTNLLRELGLEPAATVGHSVGEIAAAWAVGALDLETACRVVVARSRAQAGTRGTGRMAAVGLNAEAVRMRIAHLGLEDALEVAAENGPHNVTVSGAPSALAALGEAVSGHFFRELDLDYAFHSRAMDPIRFPLLSSLAGMRTGQSAGRFYSTVRGGVLEADALRPEYWWHNVRDPVQFGPTLAAMIADGIQVFLEVGPNAILQRYVIENISAARSEGRSLATAPQREDSLEKARAAVLRIMLLGCDVDTHAWFPAGNAAHVELPHYPWQRQALWNKPTGERQGLFDRVSCHPLLGYRLTDMPAGWESHLDPQRLPLLADHKVGGSVVLPAAGYLEMALAASREWYGVATHVVEELDIRAPIVFDGEHARTLRLTFSPTDLRFRIEGRQRLSQESWTLHALGRLLGDAPHAPAGAIHAPGPAAESIDAERHYASATAHGLDYGPAFRGIERVELDATTLRASLAWPECAPTLTEFLLHPAILDQGFQAILGWLGGRTEPVREGAFLPVGFGRLTLWMPGVQAAEVRARLLRTGPRSVLVDFELLDHAGRLVAKIDGARFRAAALVPHAPPPAQWITHARLAPLAGDGGALPGTDEFADPTELAVRMAADSSARDRFFHEVAPLLEMLPVAYARDALRAFGAGLVQNWRRGHALQRWLLMQAQSEGLLIAHADQSWTIGETGIPPTATLWNAALAGCPAIATELLRIGRVGRRLASAEDADCELLAGAFSAEEFDGNNPVYATSTQAAIEALTALLQRCRPEGVCAFSTSAATRGSMRGCACCGQSMKSTTYLPAAATRPACRFRTPRPRCWRSIRRPSATRPVRAPPSASTSFWCSTRCTAWPNRCAPCAPCASGSSMTEFC